MKRNDIDSNDMNVLKKLLEFDPLDRNKNLKIMINFLNNVEGQLVLNLDGGWGTGKTVFLKELEYINQYEFRFPERVTDTTKTNLVDDFKNKYEVFYFNAWENDLYGSPLESLIFQLLIKLEKLDKDEAIIRKRIKTIDSLLKKGGILLGNLALKGISGGLVELSDIKPEKEDLTEIITSTDEKKKAITDLLDLLSELAGKQLLIIVDELDRCKPSYAIELLEVVKHFFKSEKIVFLFASNKNELTNTIKLAYGQGFDGYKYLNRFFDFEFNLSKIDIKQYLRYKFSDEINFSYYYGEVIVGACYHFKFSMRDIDRYISLCSTLKKFWSDTSYRYSTHHFVEIIMLPYAIGLKIHNGEEFNRFIEGNGLSEFIRFCEYSGLATEELFRKSKLTVTDDKTEFVFDEEVKKIYQYITEKETPSYSDKVEKQAMRNMVEILTMMSDFSEY